MGRADVASILQTQRPSMLDTSKGERKESIFVRRMTRKMTRLDITKGNGREVNKFSRMATKKEKKIAILQSKAGRKSVSPGGFGQNEIFLQLLHGRSPEFQKNQTPQIDYDAYGDGNEDSFGESDENPAGMRRNSRALSP